MRHLPILQELFESDSLWFFVIGAVIASIFLLRRPRRKTCAVSLAAAAAVYALCELIANVPGSYAAEFIALIIGTAALGAAAASLVWLIVYFMRKRNDK